MKKCSWTSLIILLIGFFNIAIAADLSNLYQIELPVATQSQDIRADAVRDGFVQILTKISGDTDIDQNPVIKEAIKKADYYVQEFSYSAPTTNSSTYTIHIRFDSNDINKLLRKAGTAVAAQPKPQILAWVSIYDNDDNNEIIGNESQNSLMVMLKSKSSKYDVSLFFPMMDVTDLNLVSEQTINQMDINTLKIASKRYGSDSFLIGSMFATDDGWRSHWQFVFHDEKWEWSFEEKSAEVIFTKLFGQINKLLNQYSKAEEKNEWVKLEVSNITQEKDLKQLMQYLKHLMPVQQVELSQFEGNTISLSVRINDSFASFQQSAMNGQRLLLKSQDEAKNTLSYEWVH